jgi:hypothetical protein
MSVVVVFVIAMALSGRTIRLMMFWSQQKSLGCDLIPGRMTGEKAALRFITVLTAAA